MAIADAEDRILVTKDDDFVGLRLLTGRPRKLWLVTVGNCANADLEALVARAWPGRRLPAGVKSLLSPCSDGAGMRKKRDLTPDAFTIGNGAPCNGKPSNVLACSC